MPNHRCTPTYQSFSTDLVAISVATPLNLGKAKELITRIKSLVLEHPPSILIGGAAVNSNPEIWKYLAADGAAPDAKKEPGWDPGHPEWNDSRC
jgi:methanogenic corrinoid protein MtbC1